MTAIRILIGILIVLASFWLPFWIASYFPDKWFIREWWGVPTAASLALFFWVTFVLGVTFIQSQLSDNDDND